MRCHRVVYDAVHAWGQDTEEFTLSELLAGCRGSPPPPPSPRAQYHPTVPQRLDFGTNDPSARIHCATQPRTLGKSS